RAMSAIPLSCSLFMHRHPPPPPFHSFPTRRSSDLERVLCWAGRRRRTRVGAGVRGRRAARPRAADAASLCRWSGGRSARELAARSEEHTSELQSLTNLVCRLLLEKKKKKPKYNAPT